MLLCISLSSEYFVVVVCGGSTSDVGDGVPGKGFVMAVGDGDFFK